MYLGINGQDWLPLTPKVQVPRIKKIGNNTLVGYILKGIVSMSLVGNRKC